MENLLQKYREAVVEHGECAYNGVRPGIIDAVGRKRDDLLQEMVAAGKDYRLLELYNDEDLWVQLSAATHTLEIAEDQAMAKLTELATTRYGRTRTTAKYTLQEWKAGNLKFRKDSPPHRPSSQTT